MNRAAKSRRGRLAAAGVAAVAAAGLAAAPAQASGGKLYACYSKRSHVMKYSKRSHCARGSKSLSWGKTGPQGAQGAQGPGGVTAAFVGYDLSAVPFSRYSVSIDGTHYSGYSHAVDEFVPSQTGVYVVNAQTTLKNTNAGANLAGCVIYNGQSGSLAGATLSQSGTIAAAGDELPVGVTGVVYASPAHPVLDICFASQPASAATAAIDGIEVNELNGKRAVRPSHIARAGNPRQTFRKALAAHKAGIERAETAKG